MGFIEKFFAKQLPIPRHLRSQKYSEVKAYWQRRDIFGDPTTQHAEILIPQLLAYEINLLKGTSITADQCKKRFTLMEDLGLDEIETADILLNIESHYNNRLDLGGEEDEELPEITVGYMIEAVQEQVMKKK